MPSAYSDLLYFLPSEEPSNRLLSIHLEIVIHTPSSSLAQSRASIEHHTSDCRICLETQVVPNSAEGGEILLVVMSSSF